MTFYFRRMRKLRPYWVLILILEISSERESYPKQFCTSQEKLLTMKWVYILTTIAAPWWSEYISYLPLLPYDEMKKNSTMERAPQEPVLQKKTDFLSECFGPFLMFLWELPHLSHTSCLSPVVWTYQFKCCRVITILDRQNLLQLDPQLESLFLIARLPSCHQKGFCHAFGASWVE